MTPIGATSANTIPGETPVLTQETITSDPSDGFSMLLSQGKEGDSLPVQPAATLGKDEKAAISKKSAAEGHSLADTTGNISYLAACMVVIQPLPVPPESGSPVVLDSASEAEQGGDASERGSVKGADSNRATAANAPIEQAVFDSLGLTTPVPSEAIAKDGATRDLEEDTATGSDVSIKTSAVGITEGTEAAPDRAIAGKDVPKYSEVNATAQGKSPVDTIPLNSTAVAKTRLDLNAVDIGTVEGARANTAMKDQGTGEEVLPDTGITIPGPSGNLEKAGTADGIEAATAMVVNALVGKATSTTAMESALNANTTERWKATSVGEYEVTIAEQQTKRVMDDAVGESLEKASNTFATLNTPNVIEVLNSANLSEAVALNGESGPQKTSENAVPDAVSMIFQNGLLSEKFAESAAANSPFSVKSPNDKAATMAGLSDIDGQDANASTAKVAQLPISNSIQAISGMPVATHRESMPPVHAQSETKMPLSEKSDTLIVPPNASSGKVDTAKLVAADSPERKFDNGEDTASNGANFFAPSLSSTTRNVDSSSKFQMESTTKNAFQQDIPSICDHTSEAIGRMHSDGKDSVEVRLRLHDGQELTIQLRMNSGEVQPVFKTDSTDLRVALEQNWNQFSAHSADRGIRVAAPVFESGQMGTGDSQQQRQDQHFQHQPVILEDEIFQQPMAAGTRGATSLGGDEGTSSEPTVLSLFA